MTHIKKNESGEDTVAPGFYANISNEEYHKGPGVSSSGIKKVLRSGLHYWDAYINPDQDPQGGGHIPGKSLDALGFGTAYHTLIGEPHLFPEAYIVMPDLPDGCTTRNKAGKDFLEFFAKEHKDKIILNKDDMDTLRKMEKVLRAQSTIAKIYEEGQAEGSFFWTDPETGLLCKIRPDWLRKGLLMADLKTAVDASQDGFSRSIFNFGYHISAAMYLDGYKAQTGEDLNGNFIFVVQEKTRPFACAPYVIEDEAITEGRKQYRAGLELIARYKDTYGDDPWPSYATNVQGITLPAWAFRKAA